MTTDEKLPDNWNASTLGLVAHDFLSGGTPSTKNEAFWQGPVPWITSKRLNYRLYVDNGEKFISEDALKQSATCVIPRNNLIFATRVGVGKVAVNNIDLAINQDLAGVLVDSDRHDIRFLAYQLRSDRIQRTVASQKRGATIQGITRDALKELEIYLPPLVEQRKIAEVLGLVQKAIEQQERMITLTTELKKTLLHKLFTEGLHGEPQKQTDIGPVPKSWEVKLLQDCCIVQTGIAKGRKVEASEALTLPYLRVANVQAGHLDLSEMKAITIRMKERDRYLLRKGDIVLTEGGDFDKLGRGFIWNGEIEECVHQNHIFAVRVDRSRLIPEFFAHLSQSPYGKAYFLSVAHKTTNLACINTTKLKSFPVLIPTLVEQEEIVRTLEAVDAKLGQHVRKKQTLSDLFRTLLHQLMTAQIRIHELEL
ncbi:MAG: restriction endonuclease subunit S [Nitrospira sp.]|nr:restriction endonuclease subunit S [Nitrospira sp.]